MNKKSVSTKSIVIFSDKDNKTSRSTNQITVEVLEKRHISFKLEDENDGVFFCEEMPFSVAEKLRDFLVYATKK